MNQRIRLLAEHAKKHALDAMIKITDREQALKVYSESYDTKFAQLIVKECLVQVNEVYTSLDNKDKRVGAAAVGLTIAAHFGVTE